MGQLPETRRRALVDPMIAAVYARKSTDQSGVADDQNFFALRAEFRA